MINKNGFLDLNYLNGIPVVIDPVPENTAEFKNTVSMKPKYQVIHNTGNSAKSADDTANNKFMKNDDYILWHFTVDENSITQGHSIYRSAFHAGDGRAGKGNNTGIGIEICDNGDVEKATQNTFNLMAALEKEIPELVVKPHQFFSGKYCPRWILDNWGWTGFIDRYEKFKKSIEKIPDHWSEKHYQSLLKKGIVIHERRFYDTITRGELFALMDRLTDTMK